MPSPIALLDALDDVGARIKASTHFLIFLDFDGTLAPITETPQLTRLPAATRTVLERLANRDDCTVSIVSGRALDDIRTRIGIEGLIYAGNHGLEIHGGGLHFDESSAVDLKADLTKIVDALETRLSQIPGVLIEPKGLTATTHYRLVTTSDRATVESVVRDLVPEDHPKFLVAGGKMVWEVRPRVTWNKGTAVRWIREQLGLRQAMTVYLGDDRTDEDAFEVLGRFVTARVGPPQPTRAGYQISNSEEVSQFLDWMLQTVRFADSPGSHQPLS